MGRRVAQEREGHTQGAQGRWEGRGSQERSQGEKEAHDQGSAGQSRWRQGPRLRRWSGWIMMGHREGPPGDQGLAGGGLGDGMPRALVWG